MIRFLFFFAVASFVFGSAQADPGAKVQCAQYDLTNVDCTCVSKRYDAYMSVAAEPRYQALVKASYDAALSGDPDAYNEKLIALQRDMQAYMRFDAQFDSISGGFPANIDNFFEGCAIAGASKTPLPPVPSAPIYGKLYQACMDFYPDQRGCQCQVAQMGDVMSVQEAKAYYYSFNEKGNGSYDEENRKSAQKAGLSLEAYFAADKAARSKIGEYYRGKVNCSVLKWADGREGRSAAERAGTPVGFENVTQTTFVDPASEMEAARREAEAMKAQAQTDMASLPAMPSAVGPQAQTVPKALGAPQGTPLQTLLSGCEADGNAKSTCACLGGVFEQATVGASDSVARQLAFMMSGGGGEAGAMQMLQQASPQDLAQAGQLFQQNIMAVMTCQ